MDPEEVGNMIARLTGDNADFLRMMKDSEDEMKKLQDENDRLSKAMNRSQINVTGFAHAVVSAFQRINAEGTLRQLFSLFEQHEMTHVKLRAALRASGEEVSSTMKQFDEFASSISATTTTSKDATLAMLQQAKSLGLTNEQSERAIKNAIGLAATRPGDAPAESFIRMTAMVEQGNTMMLNRFLPTLRRITDPTKKVDEALRLLNNDFKVAEEVAKTSSGQIKQLMNAWADFKKELGATVAQAVKPLIGYLKTGVSLFEAMSPEAKKMIVYVLGAVAAFVSLAGAVSVAVAIFGPLVGPILGGLVTVLGLSVTSLPVLTALVIAGAAAWLYYSGSAGTAINWLTKQFQQFRAYIQPAIDGVTDAIKAGNIELAVKIVWAQIQLSFAEGSAEVQKIWSAMTDILAHTLVDITGDMSTTWGDFTAWMAKKWVDVMDILLPQFGGLPPGAAEAIKRGIDEANKMSNNRVEADRKVMHDQLNKDAEEFSKSFNKSLESLKAERDKLVKEAHEAAAKVPPIPKIKPPDIPVIPPIHVKAKVDKIDFSAFDSAEAQAKMREQAEKFGVTVTRGGEFQGKDPNTGLLRDIRDLMKVVAGKEGVQLDQGDMDDLP